MLHHVSLGVSDVERSAAFYDAILAPLGYRRVWSDLRPGERGQAVGYGLFAGEDKLAIKQRSDGQVLVGTGFHLAFSAPSESAAVAFHEIAVQMGGKNNGPAGPRPDYGPNYYAAFIIDPDGHHIEAVVSRTK